MNVANNMSTVWFGVEMVELMDEKGGCSAKVASGSDLITRRVRGHQPHCEQREPQPLPSIHYMRGTLHVVIGFNISYSKGQSV